MLQVVNVYVNKYLYHEICTFAAAMGRSQSTPGLVESRGKIALEDMWVPPTLVGLTPAYPRSLMGSPPRPPPDSPGGISTSSGRSHHQISASHGRSGKYKLKKRILWNLACQRNFSLY